MVDFKRRLSRILSQREPRPSTDTEELNIFPTRTQVLPQKPVFSLAFEADCAVLLHVSGLRRPLHRGGQPMPALPPGWAAAAVHVELAPVVIVSLAHPDGERAHWIVDISDEVYTEAVAQLPGPLRETLVSVMAKLLLDVRVRGGAALAAWNQFPRRARLELLALAWHGAAAGADGLIELLRARKADLSGTLKINNDDDLVSVMLPMGVEIPVLMSGLPLRQSTLAPGWIAETLYGDFAPFFLLELRHQGGTRATWVLDRHLRFIDDVTRLAGPNKDELCLRAAPVIDRHLESVLSFADVTSDASVQRYLQLNNAVRHIVVAGCHDRVRPSPTLIGMRQAPSVLMVAATMGGDPIPLRRDAIMQAVTTDLHQRTLKAALDGHLEWPSPVDESPALLCGIFTLDDYVFYYQFIDRNGVDFIVVASGRSCRVIGLVILAVNLMLFDDSVEEGWRPDTWMRNELGGTFWSLLLRHLSQYADEMGTRRRTPRARPINVLLALWRVHICHHLWNDLSGLEALCVAVPADRMPMTLIIGAADGGAELFGPIEALFPPTLGRIDRSLPDVDAFIRWTYRNDVWPTRITREYISTALRCLVVGHLTKTEEASQVSKALSERQEHGRAAPLIVFGLRVEDRTFVDLAAFCEAFVAFMAGRRPGSIIVFDGHNSRPGEASGAVIHGMAYSLARRPPEEVEAEIIGALQRRFAGAPVTIIGTTGQSIATSLAWCRHADAAFAIWGAGLTKYRWLANLPTMMITGRRNMLSRPDIPIYHDSAFMEASARAIFPDPSLVTDVSEHVALASGHIQAGRECFTVDIDKVLLSFDAFLSSVIENTVRLEA